MPNGLAPSSFSSCYLSRPVVWGESVRGPTPTRGSRLGGGRGPLSGCTPWSERNRQNWVWEQVSWGREVSGFGATMGLWTLLGVRGEWNGLVVFALLRVSGTWCHPRGGEAASQMCVWEGGAGKSAWLCPLFSLGTALLSGCSVGRGTGPQSVRLGM